MTTTDPTACRSRRDRARATALAAGVVAAGVALRLALLPRGAEHEDAVNFILALDSYDLPRYQPHFPGYPLFIAAARVLGLAGLDPETALRAVGALAGALLPVPLWSLLAGGRRAPRADGACSELRSLAVAAAASLTPAVALGSVALEADVPALLLVLFACREGQRGRAGACGGLTGLALGVRLGALPIVAGVLCWLLAKSPPSERARVARRAVAGLALGVLAWWLPQLAVVGPSVWLEQATFFVGGHFTDWGGSVVTRPDPAMRATLLVNRLGAALGAGATAPGWLVIPALLTPGVVLVSVGIVGRRLALGWLVAIVASQGLTAALLQNLERLRHVAPLALCVAIAGLEGWSGLRGRIRWLAALVAVLLAARGVQLLAERAASTPPLLAAVRTTIDCADADGVWVFCGESHRLFDLEDPARRLVIRRARDLDGLVHELNASPQPPRRVVAFSELAGQDVGHGVCSRTGNPLVFDAARIDIFLYDVVGDAERGAVSVEPHTGDALRRRWLECSRNE